MCDECERKRGIALQRVEQVDQLCAVVIAAVVCDDRLRNRLAACASRKHTVLCGKVLSSSDSTNEVQIALYFV